MTDELLKRQQIAGHELESEMLEFLLQFAPVAELPVSAIKTIAFKARVAAFEKFSRLK